MAVTNLHGTNQGYVYKTGLTWDTVHHATSGIKQTANIIVQTTAGYRADRGFLEFAIPAGEGPWAGGVVGLKTVTPSTGELVLVAGTQTNPLANADYDACGAVELSDRIHPTLENTVYEFTLNAAGIAHCVAGQTAKFCIREAHDIDDVTPTGTVNTTFYDETQVGEEYHPYLTLYDAPPPDPGSQILIYKV